MKPTPQDMLDTLKTGEDKLAKIEEMREELRDSDYKLTVKRRKLKAGQKYYFDIEYVGGEFWTGNRCAEVAHLIYHYFPEASLTSGGPKRRVYRED